MPKDQPRKGNETAVPSRRKILIGQQAASAAAAIVATLIVPRGVHAGADETIKVALIGCGGRGTGAAAQALSTSGPVKLWAMADTFADRLESSHAALMKLPDVGTRVDVPTERRFVGLDSYCWAIDSGADLVLLTTTPAYRPLHFEYAVKAGKHVFMEKPVATDAPGVRRLLAANEQAQRQGLKVGVGLQRHHDPAYLEMHRRVRDGAIGDVGFYRCYWNSAAPGKKPIARESMTELEYQLRNWYFFNWLSGDHIVEQHIHNIDVCNWFKDAVPVSAQGLGGRQVRTGAEYGNIFDHHAVEFTYADGTKMFSQCRQTPGCRNRVEEYAHGTRGWADLSGGRLHPADGPEVRLRASTRQSKRTGDPTNPFQIEHNDLFAAIRSGADYNEAEYGALSTMTAILGRMATYSGQMIAWNDALNSQQALTTDAEDFQAPAPLLPNERGRYAIAVPGMTKTN